MRKGGHMKLSLVKGYRFLILLIVTTVIGIQLSWTSPHSEEEAVIALVEQFFKALETRDADLAKNILMPEGVVYFVREEGGEKLIRAATHKANHR
jgi:hypothetical protein